MPPVDGSPLLINPRTEDPLQWLHLDLSATLRFLPALNLSGRDKRRAEYTIELLKLNRDYLVRGRSATFVAFQDILRGYIQSRNINDPQALLDMRINAIRDHYHRTVWMEMIRQRQHYQIIDGLFTQAPEALAWV